MSTQAITKSEGAIPKTVKGWLTSDYFKKQVALCLPKHLTADRFVRVAISALTRIPKLTQCTPESVLKCMMACSELGIEPDGRRAHLIPFGKECTLIVDYKGLVELAKRSGDVSNIHAEIVCERDDFSWDTGEVKHRIDFKTDRGPMFAVYAVINFKDGGKHTEVMTKADVDRIRKRSKAANNGPWVTDYDEMAKKGLAVSTPIPTPNGWTTMGKLSVGTFVFDREGIASQVLGISEVKSLPCYKITFSNGDSIICDDEHFWIAGIGANAARDRALSGWKTHSVEDLFEAKLSGKSISLPVVKPLQLTELDLPIDPWLLGYWLGNGTSRGATLTCHKNDAGHVIDRVEQTAYRIGCIRSDKRSNGITIGVPGGLLDDLRSLGLLQNKHIPAIYLRGSESQRLELLRGLMDSDGCIERSRGRAIFVNTNDLLCDAVFELASSLGETPYSHAHTYKGFGKVISAQTLGWKPALCPVSLPRKVARFTDRKIQPYRSISSIERVESVLTKCIAVDSPTNSYLAGKSFIPTHNTVFRRASKWITLSPEIRDALERDADGFQNGAALVSETSLALPEGEAPETEKEIVGPPIEVEQIKLEPKKESEKSDLQQELAEVVTNGGYTFGHFVAWAEETGNLPDAGSIPDFGSVPSDICKRLLRAKVGLLKGLEMARADAV